MVAIRGRAIMRPQAMTFVSSCGAALDVTKDQSYVLSFMTQDQLAHTLLPLGGFTKAHVREIAEQQGFINAQKHDSQDMLRTDGDYLGFLERYRGSSYEPGEIVDAQGKVLGQHKGAPLLHHWAAQGDSASGAPEPYFVLGKNMAANQVVVGRARGTLVARLRGRGGTGLCRPPLSAGETMNVQVKAHYRQSPIPAELSIDPDGSVRAAYLRTSPGARSWPGTCCLLGDSVVGGGTIVNLLGVLPWRRFRLCFEKMPDLRWSFQEGAGRQYF